MGAEIYRALNEANPSLKEAVRQHWQSEPCESRFGRTTADRRKFFEEIDSSRWETSPFIHGFARFDEGAGKRVLEVGLGSGSDFMQWARRGARLWGRDLTQASVDLIRERLALEGLAADVALGDVEALEFEDGFFDLVYSYGVIHHTPDTPRAIAEIHRVLKPGGVARIMIYHARGMSVFFEWLLFGPLSGKPFRSARDVMFHHNESLGTKIYTRREARDLFAVFGKVNLRTVVDHGDLLDIPLSPRYRKVWLLRQAVKLSPVMKMLNRVLPSTLGTTMLIEAVK
jgi:SAM-dependent methyltransferase